MFFGCLCKGLRSGGCCLSSCVGLLVCVRDAFGMRVHALSCSQNNRLHGLGYHADIAFKLKYLGFFPLLLLLSILLFNFAEIKQYMCKNHGTANETGM